MARPGETQESAEDRERELEVEAVEEGRVRLLERLGSSPGTSPVTGQVINDCWDKLCSKIEEVASEARRKATGKGRPSNPTGPLLQLQRETLAFITLCCLLENLARPRALEKLPEGPEDDTSDHALGKGLPESRLSKEIARHCELEHFSGWLRQSKEQRLEWARRPFSREVVEKRLVSIPPWKEYKRGRGALPCKCWEALGSILVCIAKDEDIGLLESYTDTTFEKGGTKTQKMVKLGERASKLIELVPPCFALPMLSKPKPWATPGEGGYVWRPMALVKHHDNHSIRKAVNKAATLGPVYDAINALQGTPWRVNRFVYDVVAKMLENGQHFPEVPTKDEVRELKRRGRPRRAHEEAEKARLYLKLIQDRVDLAKRLLEEERFYFPYQLDFRGRAYAVPQLFNPQSDGMGRALLEFADGKHLGKEGGFWLAVHLANMWGQREGDSVKIDKQTFDKRVKWAYRDEIKRQISNDAQDPWRENSLWKEAKKPWRFLAACVEWVAYLKEGEQFHSHIPVAMDGTCNGFQHLSAMLLDRRGAEATNVCPPANGMNDEPRDIYAVVAQNLKQKLDVRLRAEDDRELAQKWLDIGIDRDIVKPGTMTTPYGAGRDTKCRQLMDVIGKKGNLTTLDQAKNLRSFLARCHRDVKSWSKENRIFPPLAKVILSSFKEGRMIESWLDRAEWQLANYLVGLLDESVRETCRAHGKIEKWLQDLAGELAKKGKGIQWTSPSNFPVVQAKWIYPERKVGYSGPYRGCRVPDTSKAAKGIDRKAQKRGIVPNFVHSFDAAHMVLTINALHRQGQGLQHFGVVHDSYAVHACEVEKLRSVLRETFFEIYKGNVLQDFWRQVKAENPDVQELKQITPPGPFDDFSINEVLRSEYFFS